MLYLYNTLPENLKSKYHRSIMVAFDRILDKQILTEPFVKDMIQSVDKSTVLYPNIIDSPYLGPIPPERLSGGVKALVILYSNQFDFVLPTHLFGENCKEWILKIATHKDIVLYVTSVLVFDGKDLEITDIALNNRIYTKDSNKREFFAEYSLMPLTGEHFEGVFV